MIYTNIDEILPRILSRGEAYEESYLPTVYQIINDVKKNGDRALKKYSERFDNNFSESFEISKKDLITAYDNTDEQLKLDLQLAKKI